MKLLSRFSDPSCYRGGIVAIGNFDGVHLGHRAMLARLVAKARSLAVHAVVLTFDPHPLTLLRPHQAPPPITTPARKAQLLAECGVDCTISYPTTPEFLTLSPDEFFASVIQQELAASGLIEGPNFFYGRDRAGTVSTLQDQCRIAGISLEIIQPREQGGRLISSSRVRELLLTGEVAWAADMLGTRYQLQGKVTTGAQRGRTIGFPTANLTQVATLLPAEGVYAARAWLSDAASEEQKWFAAVNLGPNPTFGEQTRKLEVHLLDFTGDLYGRTLVVEFVQRLRGTVPFPSREALMAQLHADIAQCRAIL